MILKRATPMAMGSFRKAQRGSVLTVRSCRIPLVLQLRLGRILLRDFVEFGLLMLRAIRSITRLRMRRLVALRAVLLLVSMVR
jgi:hypothetical protein